MEKSKRTEKDRLGEMTLPEDVFYGIQTAKIGRAHV
jgi:aspartate ammonia-lyase